MNVYFYTIIVVVVGSQRECKEQRARSLENALNVAHEGIKAHPSTPQSLVFVLVSSGYYLTAKSYFNSYYSVCKNVNNYFEHFQSYDLQYSVSRLNLNKTH